MKDYDGSFINDKLRGVCDHCGLHLCSGKAYSQCSYCINRVAKELGMEYADVVEHVENYLKNRKQAMTDEQKVFIRGVEGRGDEVIKTLTDLGGKNPLKHCGSDPELIYFISPLGVLKAAKDDSEAGLMVKEYCHEIRLPEQWHGGDILVCKNDSNTFAVYNYDLNGGDYFKVYFQVGTQTFVHNTKLTRSNYQKADDYDALRFQQLLRQYGKHWNEQTKELEDYHEPLVDVGRNERLRMAGVLTRQDYGTEEANKASIEQLPDDDTLYFYITSVGDVQAAVVKNIIDRTRFRIGNFFHTREEANGTAEKVKNLLKGGHE